jgi:hypothetical protein
MASDKMNFLGGMIHKTKMSSQLWLLILLFLGQN